MKRIVLLGSTGSVGKSVLDVVRSMPGEFKISAIAGRGNVGELARQAEEFGPEKVIIANEALYGDMRDAAPRGTEVTAGEDALLEAASTTEAEMVFMAISGTAALRPILGALEAGRTVALASKEPVVSAGHLIKRLVDSGKGRILPVDSEHSAVLQCLEGRKISEVRTLCLTGSGGPLKDMGEEAFSALTVERVLNHPKWEMGPKITVDSATLMNKGLEVIEARWLFDIDPGRIKVVIHPEAVVHSMVEFIDGTVKAGLFSPDMRFPVLRALSYPGIYESGLPRIDLVKTGRLTFMEPDRKKFPALDLACEALDRGGTIPAVLNAANERAVNLFLEGRIPFTGIIPAVENVIKKHKPVKEPGLADVVEAEHWAKMEIGKIGKV